MRKFLFMLASIFAGFTIAITGYALYDVLKRGEFETVDLIILMFGCFIFATILNPGKDK